jgi:hypothetical protein
MKSFASISYQQVMKMHPNHQRCGLQKLRGLQRILERPSPLPLHQDGSLYYATFGSGGALYQISLET